MKIYAVTDKITDVTVTASISASAEVPDAVKVNDTKTLTVPDTSVSLTKTENKYYVYTAATTGRYAISYTATPTEADITVQYGMGSFENATHSINNDEKILIALEVPEGERYSFRMSNPDLKGNWRECTDMPSKKLTITISEQAY